MQMIYANFLYAWKTWMNFYIPKMCSAEHTGQHIVSHNAMHLTWPHLDLTIFQCEHIIKIA